MRLVFKEPLSGREKLEAGSNQRGTRGGTCNGSELKSMCCWTRLSLFCFFGFFGLLCAELFHRVVFQKGKESPSSIKQPSSQNCDWINAVDKDVSPVFNFFTDSHQDVPDVSLATFPTKIFSVHFPEPGFHAVPL